MSSVEAYMDQDDVTITIDRELTVQLMKYHDINTENDYSDVDAKDLHDGLEKHSNLSIIGDFVAMYPEEIDWNCVRTALEPDELDMISSGLGIQNDITKFKTEELFAELMRRASNHG